MSASKPKKKRSLVGQQSKKDLDKARGKTRVHLGAAFTQWRNLRDEKGLKTDCELALLLLDRCAAPSQDDVGVNEQSTFLGQHNVCVDIDCLLQLFKQCGRCSCDCVVKRQGNGWCFSVVQYCQFCNQLTTWNSQNSDTRKTSSRNENGKKGRHNDQERRLYDSETDTASIQEECHMSIEVVDVKNEEVEENTGEGKVAAEMEVTIDNDASNEEDQEEMEEEEEEEEEEVQEERCSSDPEFDPGIEVDTLSLSSQKTQDQEQERHRGLCPDCGLLYTIRKHQHKCEHKTKLFPCLDCGKRCVTDVGLKAHRRTHQDNHPCRYCLKPFRTQSDKQNHEKNHSSKEKRSYQCSECPQTFNNARTRNHHLKEHEARRLICPICYKEFPTRHRLERHEVSHSVNKPHRCQVCERTFAQGSQLKSHLRIHTGERPFQCKFCLKSFNHKISLKNHIRRYHPGESYHSSDPGPDSDPRNPGESSHSSDPDPKQQEETFHGTGPDPGQDPRKHGERNPEPGSAQGSRWQGERAEVHLRTEQERGQGGEVEDHMSQEQGELTLWTEWELGEGGKRKRVKQGKRYQSSHWLPFDLEELEKEEEEEEEEEISNNSDSDFNPEKKGGKSKQKRLRKRWGSRREEGVGARVEGGASRSPQERLM